MTSLPGNSINIGMPHFPPAHAQFILIPHLCDSVSAHLSRSDIAQCLRVCQSWSDAFKPYLWTRLDLSDYQLFHRFITSAVIPDDEDPATAVFKQLSKEALQEPPDPEPKTTPHSLASKLKECAIQTGSSLAWMEYSYYLAMPASVSRTLCGNHNRSLLDLLRMPHGMIRNSCLIVSLQVEFHSRLAPCSIVGSPSDIMIADAYSTIPTLPVLVPGVHTMDFHHYDNTGKNLGVDMDMAMGATLEQLSSLSLLPASHQQSAFMSFLSQCENLVRLSLVCVGSETVADNLAFYCPVLEELELKCRRKCALTMMTPTTTTAGGGRSAKTGSKDYNFHCSDRAIARLILSATSFVGFLHENDVDSNAFVAQGQGPPQRQLKKFAVDNVDRFGQKSIEALVRAHPRLEVLSIKNCQSVKSDHWHLLLNSLVCLREADFQSEGEHGHKSARAQTGLRERSSGILQFVPVVSLESLLVGTKNTGAISRPLTPASLSKARWICGATLRVLKLGIAKFSYSYPQEILPLLEQNGPTPEVKGMYTWLFSHLAGLEQLQELWLSDHLLDHGPRSRTPYRHGAGGSHNGSVVGSVTFHLTLEAGLDMLAGLKRLRVLDFRDLDHRIGFKGCSGD
ncbi:hypothetical protein BG000_001540 [Podila horticola]|nr:hypothetical protein BG000_001540 [Podila horticola]